MQLRRHAGRPGPRPSAAWQAARPHRRRRPRLRKPPAETVDPERFGDKKRLDPAYGAFQRGLYVTALNLAMPRARNGDPAAQTLVAEILSRGLGVPRNEVEAAKWYALASEQGVPEAQFQYALLLLDGGLCQEGRQRRLCAARGRRRGRQRAGPVQFRAARRRPRARRGRHGQGGFLLRARRARPALPMRNMRCRRSTPTASAARSATRPRPGAG